MGDAGYVRWTENYGEPPVTFYSSQGLPMHMLVDAGSARPKSAANANGTLFVSLVHIHLSVLKFFLHDIVSCVGACTASSVCMWLLSVSHFFFLYLAI